MSSFLIAETEPSACCAAELGLGTADGLIEIDFRGNMLTGSLPALLARLPIVVRALCMCLSHSSLSVSAVGTVCSCDLLLLPEVFLAPDDIMYQSPASSLTATPFDSHRSVLQHPDLCSILHLTFVPHPCVACYRVWMWATINSPAASMHCWVIASILSASRQMAICCLGHFQQIWPL